MTEADLLSLFRRSGALLEGHFKLSSGLHSPGYLQSALVLQWPRDAEALGRALGDRTRAWGATCVLSPALGGLIIGQEVGRALDVRAIFAERVEKTLTLRRGFALSAADRVLVVEDVVTTGLSTKETIEVARQAGGTVVGVGSLVDRSGGRHSFDVPFASLMSIDLPTYQPEQCPLCAAGSEATKPGSRRT